MANASSWRIDDMDGGLDGGLASELLNLSGLGNEFGPESRAYNMSDVLNLSLFKDEPSEVFQNIMDTVDSNSVAQVTVETTSSKVHQTPPQKVKQEPLNPHITCISSPQVPQISSVRGQENGGYRFLHILRVPTSPTKRLEEDSLTYLNQGQSYLVELKCLSDTASEFDGQYLKSVIKLGFYERKLQVQESEKYQEWQSNRPADRIVEIDVPMSSGIYNIRSKGSLLNSYEFEWDPHKETKLYVIINCVSSEFTKGKSGGESGVPFKLQVDSFLPSSSTDVLPIHSSACQVKVFKSKGADRKHKAEMQKLDLKTKDELKGQKITVEKEKDQLRPSFDCTELTEIAVNSEEENTSCWMSPRSVGSVASPSQAATAVASPRILSSPSPSVIPCASVGLTSESTVDETRVWLQNNRFQNYLTMFANYTGADILRLTKQDMVQIMGPADGIRLHNSLQARAVRPLVTMYICLESAQQNSGMKEYHAMFLEVLNLNELRKKLALKCNLSAEQIVAIYRQGPTGIYVLVDDEMVRNFVDEGHFILQLVREEDNMYQVVLK